MKNINFQKQTIEMTKTFANSASNYGSEAYNELMNAKRDFPSYTVSIVKAASKKRIPSRVSTSSIWKSTSPIIPMQRANR